jgi:hypothetical protein
MKSRRAGRGTGVASGLLTGVSKFIKTAPLPIIVMMVPHPHVFTYCNTVQYSKPLWPYGWQ